MHMYVEAPGFNYARMASKHCQWLQQSFKALCAPRPRRVGHASKMSPLYGTNQAKNKQHHPLNIHNQCLYNNVYKQQCLMSILVYSFFRKCIKQCF